MPNMPRQMFKGLCAGNFWAPIHQILICLLCMHSYLREFLSSAHDKLIISQFFLSFCDTLGFLCYFVLWCCLFMLAIPELYRYLGTVLKLKKVWGLFYKFRKSVVLCNFMVWLVKGKDSCTPMYQHVRVWPLMFCVCITNSLWERWRALWCYVCITAMWCVLGIVFCEKVGGP